MAVNCDPNALLDEAKCFRCIPDGMQSAVQTFLLAVIAGGSTDPEVLMKQAACFRCADGMHAEIQTMLLCSILNK